MVYSWIKDTIADHSRNSLCWGASFQAGNMLGGKPMMDVFCSNYLCPSLRLPPMEKLCYFPLGLRLWGPWHGCTHIHSGPHSLYRGTLEAIINNIVKSYTSCCCCCYREYFVCSFVLFVFFFKIGSHVSLIGLELLICQLSSVPPHLSFYYLLRIFLF